MSTTPVDPFDDEIKAAAELARQSPEVTAGFFAGGAADRDAEIAAARGMTYRKPPGYTRLASLLGSRDEAGERDAEAGS